MAKNTGKFFLAGLLGAITGAIGGLLLAPQSGEKTRKEIAALAAEIAKRIKNKSAETKEEVKDIFGKYSQEGEEKYKEIKDAVVSKVAAIKTAGENIDKEKYGMVVENVVNEFKGDLASTKNGANKIVTYLKKDWEKIKKALA